MNNQKILPWHVVEQAIFEEKKWLIRAFDFGQEGRKDKIIAEPTVTPLPPNEMLRQLSIAIVSGKVRVRELNTEKINGLWTDDSTNWELGHNERHGGDWHKAMMGLIKNHFSEGGFELTTEPYLNWGRADIGVYKQGYKNLFVEVGSTSVFKVWLNSHTMPDSIFLFVPSVYYAIEFRT